MKRLTPLLLAAALCLSGCVTIIQQVPAATPTPAPISAATPSGDLDGLLAWIEEKIETDLNPTMVTTQYDPETNSIIITYREDSWAAKIAERDADWWEGIPEACQQLMEYIIVCAGKDYGVTGVDFLFLLYCGEETPLMILNTDIVKDYMKTEE